jgi:YVTN family beta-propeller protein
MATKSSTNSSPGPLGDDRCEPNEAWNSDPVAGAGGGCSVNSSSPLPAWSLAVSVWDLLILPWLHPTRNGPVALLPLLLLASLARAVSLGQPFMNALFLSLLFACAFLPLLPTGAAGGFRAYVTTAEGVVVIDTANNAVLANISLGLPANITVSPDGALLFVPQAQESRIAVIDARTYTPLDAIPVPGRPGGLALTPDGALGVTVTRGACEAPELCDAVSVIDARRLDFLGAMPLPGRSGSFALTPDGALAIVTTQMVCTPQGQCVGADTVSIFDLVERRLGAISLPGRPGGFVLTPDGTRGLVATQRNCELQGQCVGANTLSIFDVVEGRVVAAVPPWGPFFEPGSMAITPDGASAYVMEEDSGPVGIIDLYARRISRATSSRSGREGVLGSWPQIAFRAAHM